MRLYRLYLGGNNTNGARFPVRQVSNVVGRFSDGFTLIKAHGYWQGKSEGSWIIEVGSNVHYTQGIGPLVEALKNEFQQECIGLTVAGELEIK